MADTLVAVVRKKIHRVCVPLLRCNVRVCVCVCVSPCCYLVPSNGHIHGCCGCVCTCVLCVYMCVCVCVCMCWQLGVHVCVCVCVCACVHACVRVCVCVHACRACLPAPWMCVISIGLAGSVAEGSRRAAYEGRGQVLGVEGL